VREAAFRVVQEGLSNAVRHGRPTEIRVALSETGSGQLVVRVQDDGQGSEPGPRREPGFGIAGMRERVAMAGGDLDIAESEPERGWTVTARLPAGRKRRASRRAAAA
jgi:two-component system sensor histidine kinase UhpB